MWRLLPCTVRSPSIRLGVCCVGGRLFTPALAWESAVLSTLIPVTCLSPLASQPPLLPIHPQPPSHFTSHTWCPPQASLAASPRFPYLSPSTYLSPPHPYHFHFGRPPSAQGHDLSRGRLVDPLPTRSPPGLPSGMPIHSRLTPFPSAPSLPPVARHPHSLRRGRCGRSGKWGVGREASDTVGLRTVTVLLPPPERTPTFFFP